MHKWKDRKINPIETRLPDIFAIDKDLDRPNICRANEDVLYRNLVFQYGQGVIVSKSWCDIMGEKIEIFSARVLPKSMLASSRDDQPFPKSLGTDLMSK